MLKLTHTDQMIVHCIHAHRLLTEQALSALVDCDVFDSLCKLIDLGLVGLCESSDIAPFYFMQHSLSRPIALSERPPFLTWNDDEVMALVKKIEHKLLH